MRANPRRDTAPERRLRSALHALGLRYRVDLPIPVPGRRPVRPDVVFTRAHVCVFVDGCFWHSCPLHGTQPQRNGEYWGPKLERNRMRDRQVDAALLAAGWRVVRVWEHEDPQAAAESIQESVAKDSCSAQTASGTATSPGDLTGHTQMGLPAGRRHWHPSPDKGLHSAAAQLESLR